MKKEIDMIHGPLAGSLIKLVIPIIATGVLQVLYNAADIIVIGQFSPPDSPTVGAIGSTTALINLIIGLFTGLAVGINVALAMSIGRGDNKGSSEVVHTSVLLAVICGLGLSAVGFFGAHTFLEWMHSPDEVIELSALYMRIYFLGIPGSLLYNFGSAILRAKGDTRAPFFYLMISGLVNIGLNFVFIAFFKMSVDGVALATIISQYISAICVLVHLTKLDDCCKLDIRMVRLNKDKVVTILKYGIPAGFAGIMFNISNVFIQSSLNSFNIPDMLTGASSAGSLEGIIYQGINAFQHASLTFVGQNMGAKNYKRIPKIFITALIMSFSLSLVCGWGMYLMGPTFLRLYAPNANEAVIEYGLVRMSCILVFYTLDATLEVQMGVIRGMGFSTPPTLCTVIGICCVRIVWIYTVFRKVHTMKSLYMCYPVTWAITIVALALTYFIIKKKVLPKQGILLSGKE